MKNKLKKYKNLRYGMKFITFKREYLKNPLQSPTQLALEIYDCKDENSARAITSENFHKLSLTLPDIMNRSEHLTTIDDIEDLARLSHAKKVQSCDLLVKNKNGKLVVNENSNDFIEIDDSQVQAKILELRLKLKGYLRNESQTNIQVNLQTVLSQVRGHREKNGNGSGTGKHEKIEAGV